MTKHTILFLAANPGGTDRLALDKEARAIQLEFERSGFRDSFELVTRWAAEPLDLLRELRKLKPSVVHFSGHGMSKAASARGDARWTHRDIVVERSPVEPTQHGIYFQSPDGRPQLVSADAFAQVFGAAGSSVKLVTLSACYSDAQAAALVAHVGCVVGMGGAFGDDAARSFAIGFYGGLGERESVAAAYRQGCAAIGLEGVHHGDKPRLNVRDGVDAEQIVLAELVNGDPTAWSRGSVSSPTPVYANAEVQALSEQIEDARARRERLRNAGVDTGDVDREILELRRKLRDGGQLRAGDALGDGRYLLIKELGRGGFARVWEAYDRTEERRVAVKVLHPHLAGEPQRRERFFRGARVMMELQHSAVVRVYDPRGEDEAFCYFVMELVPGGNLRDAVLSKRIEPRHVVSLILQVGEALAEAHRQQLIHRDVKPSNILLDDHGNAKLTDFDLVGGHDTTGGTRTGMLGTFVYAAPECLDKPQEATARADVFSLGMTTLFCLSGQDLSIATFRDPEVAVGLLTCPEQLRLVLSRAVAWELDYRFIDAGTMVNALRDADDQTDQDKTVADARTGPRLASGEGTTPRVEPGQLVEAPHADDRKPARDVSERPNAFRGAGDQTDQSTTVTDAGTPPRSASSEDRTLQLDRGQRVGTPNAHDRKVLREVLERPMWTALRVFSPPRDRRSSFYGVSGIVAVSVAAGVAFLIIRSTLESAPTTGSVNLESAPSNAEVRFDGTLLTDRTPLTIDGAPVGTRHKVTISLPHYKSHTEDVDIPKTGRLISIVAQLTTLKGTILVATVPSGAEIRINGQLRGVTPTKISEVEIETTSSIELRHKDFPPHKIALKWRDDGVAAVEHHFTPAALKPDVGILQSDGSDQSRSPDR